MSRSNWKGSAGWQSIDDPTGVLEKVCLHASSGIGQLCQDYLIQEIGTSNAFNKTHYKVQCDFALVSDETFLGSFALVARADNYTTSTDLPLIPQQSYIALIDFEINQVKIFRKFDAKDFLLISSAFSFKVPSNSKNTISLSCYGDSSTGGTSLILELNNKVIGSAYDFSGNQLLSGAAGMQVQNGSVYVNNFAVMELDSAGNPV